MKLIYKHTRDIDPEKVCVFMNNFATWKVHPQVNKWQAILSNSEAVISAWDGAKLVGFARGISDKVRYAQVLDVLVHADYRGHGIGRALLDRLVSEPAMRVRAVILGTPNQREFYEAVGFKCVNDRAYFMVMVRDEYGEELIQPVMNQGI